MQKLLIIILAITSTQLLAQRNLCAVSKQNKAQHKAVVSSSVQTLEENYDVKFYHLNIDVEITGKYIEGNVRTLAKVVSTTLDTFAFELHPNHAIDSILINGQPASYSRISAAVYCNLPQVFLQNQMIDAVVYYHGTAPTSGSSAIDDGFNNKNSPSWGNTVTWSLSESFVAYEWWPCKQQLRDKADSSYCFITTDSTNKAGSNGKLTAVIDLGNGKKRYEWKSHHAIDYYLISVAVAKYIDYSFYAHPAGGDSILIQNYVYDNPNTLSNFQTVIDQTGELIEFFSDKFGLYFFNDEKYGHCMAPLSGGMEHQTMTTIGFFEFTLVAHELAHQWFGDNVTCKTWSDIFVNEGFAAYSEYLALEHFSPTQKDQHMMDVHTSVMSQIGGSIWFTDTANTNRIFNSRLSYDKGSALLHMLRYEINNDSIFFLGLRTYQQQYSKHVATALDFKAVMETITGLDLNYFFNQWFYGQGYPTFNVKYNQTGNWVTIKNTETVSMASATPFFKTHIDYLVQTSLGDTIIKSEQLQSTEYIGFNVNGTVTGIVVDPLNWIVNKINSVGKDTTLSIEEIATNESLIYPNPTEKIMYVNGKIQVKQIRILDINGKFIFETYQGNSIEVNSLPSGFYFIEITDKNGMTHFQKFIKK